MSKKLLNKLLSAILVLAICSATVFGCLLNVSAADYNGTYTFSGGIAAYGAKQASVDLKFDLAEGFAGVEFDVANTANSDFTNVTVKVKSGTTQDGSAFDASNIVAELEADETGASLGHVIISTSELKYYTSLTLELTYTMTNWVKAGGAKYATDIANVVVAAESDVDVAITGTAGYIHNHHAWLNDSSIESTKAGDGYHYVYDTTCRICSSNYPIKQVMANYTQISGGTAVDKYPNGNLGISGVNVVYNDDGTINLMIHGYSPYYRGGNYIVVTDTDGKILDKYELKTNTTSQYAGSVLVDNAQVWTIENLSASDIDTELLLTMMYNDNGTIRNSTTVSFSLDDYLIDVVEGNAVWTADATAAQIEADKDVAAALYYYGASIDGSVFEHIYGDIDNSTTTTVKTKKTVKWTISFAMNTEELFQASLGKNDGSGTAQDPYIIRTAEQFAYIANFAGANSAGKYYKVADDIGAFDFTSYSKDLTATEVGEAYPNQEWKHKWYNNANSSAFQGTFDGNGAIFYGVDGRSWQTGLFPRVNGATIKNLIVQASRFADTGGSGAGAIVGKADTSITISNCVVKNCYITTDKGTAPMGTVVGALSNFCVTSISDCLVMNNIVTASTAYPYGGITSGSNYYHSGDYNFSNIIAIGNTPFATLPASPSYQSSAVNNAGNYSNVYTDQTVDTATYSDSQVKQLTAAQMQGANALSTMSLDSSVWFATTAYPELKAIHELVTVSNGKNGHTLKCVDVLDDVECGLVGSVAAHNLIENTDGTLKECSCGYSEKIISSIKRTDKSTVTWTISFAMNTEELFQASLGENDGSGTAQDPYIITTAEQFAYIANFAGANSAGKYYKVADDIGAFDFTSYSKDLTATEVNEAYAVSGWKNKWYNNANSYPFQGTFDGNGAVFFGVDGRAYQTGLFPYVSGATIKNLTVQASRFACTADTGAAAIVGKVNSNTTITISNCVVKNCYITTESTGPALATMVGKLGNFVVVNISDCLVMNNIVTASTAYPYGGITSGSNYYHSGDYNLSNIIAIGNTPFATLPASPAYNSSAVNNAGNYSNVYTDQTVDAATYSDSQVKQLTAAQMQGADALSTMSLDSSVWFNTATYPELYAMHDMTPSYIDENTHKLVCQVWLDNAQCNTCGVVEKHNLVANGNLNECACGYSEELKIAESLNLPSVILARLNANTTFTTKFATGDLFKAAYAADVNPTDNTSDCYFYATSLNLKTNPYIAFTFAFMNDYKTNKANVSVKFVVDGETIATVSGADMVNNEGAGRYHLYRLKEIPVTKMCKQVSVSLVYNGSTVDMGSYSAAGYAINAINAGEGYEYHANVAMALVYYSEMLAARYGA